MNLKNLINWKLYFILLTASLFSIIAIMPYIMTVQGEVLRAAPVPLPLVIIVAILQSFILIAILLFIGLKLSKKLGFKIPILEGYINKQKIDINIKAPIKISILLGCLAGIIIILLDFLFIKLGVNVMGQTSIPIWQGFLASFYGGISEEIIMRLFFMTFILWLISKLVKVKTELVKNNFLVWSAIIIASILFGLGHLPITTALTTITPLVIFRALLLNGVGGLVFGWLYWKKGLEFAIIAHFSADIMLHVIFFPLISTLY
ncbi:MAG: CPBP family intramembrane glutamic endopeptidase [Patescibacteria group bacterium]